MAIGDVQMCLCRIHHASSLCIELYSHCLFIASFSLESQKDNLHLPSFSRSKRQQTIIHRKNRRKNLNLLTPRRRVVRPVQQQARLADQRRQIKRRVRLAYAVMRARAEDEPILSLLLGGAGDPAVRVEEVRVRVGVRVVQGGI